MAQQVEANFFQPLDSLAAEVLLEYERTRRQPLWNDHKRTAWTRFILSLLLRNPDDIDCFRKLWNIELENLKDGLDEEYLQQRGEGDPSTFSEYIRSLPLGLKEKYLFEAYMRTLDLKEIGQKINDMHWSFFQVLADGRQLFTSDSPVIRSATLKEPMGHIALPVGPTSLFLATTSTEALQHFLRANHKKLIEACNRETVGAAHRFSFSLDDSQPRFFHNHHGKSNRPRLSVSVLALKLAEVKL